MSQPENSVCSEDALQVSQIPLGQECRIQPLFREVFGHELSPEMLHWKYAQGRGASWGGWDSAGRLIVHCGLFYRNVLAGGGQRRIVQLGDLMASTGGRGGLARRHAPFYQLIMPILTGLATKENPESIAFGFPSDRAMRLGEHLGLFQAIDQMFELVFPPSLPGCCAYASILIENIDNTAEKVLNRLWRQMAVDLSDGLVGVRDPDYLRYRYFSHPEHRYRCYLVRSFWLRRPIGAFIIKGEGPSLEIMDIIAPLNHITSVLRAAREWLASTGGERLVLWLASSHVARLADQADSVIPLEFRIMANPFTPADLLTRFDKRWWLTSGDTDYR